jgi:hypothetical protein
VNGAKKGRVSHLADSLKYLQELRASYKDEVREHNKNILKLEIQVELKNEIVWNLNDAIKLLEDEEESRGE